jgi:hypothetical protein
LIAIAKPFYFAHYSGQMAVASSLEAKAGDKLVRVGFSNSYRGTTDDAAILRVTGESRNRWDRLRQTALPARSRLLRSARHRGMRINGAAIFKQSFELKIKGDLIPEAAAEEIIGELQALFARHNAGAALSAPSRPRDSTRPATRSIQRIKIWRSTVENAGRVRDRFRESGNPQGRRGWANPASTWFRSQRA